MLKPVTRKRGRASKLPVPASWTTGRVSIGAVRHLYTVALGSYHRIS